jgi:NDP-sugar pyrophosphorylase family protein
MILHQVEALAAAGVTGIVLAVNYRPEIMEKHLAEVSLAAFAQSLEQALTVCAPSTNPDSTSRSLSPSNQNRSALQAL